MNIPVGLLIWVMIIPMLVKVDFGALQEIKQHVRGIGVTLFVNWAVKPFSMALLGWLFIRQVFAPFLPADQLDSYIAGLILLAAAPCTAMVFVWSRLTGGDPLFTLSQVALNDSIMVLAFAPLVAFLLGVSAITVPWDTLLTSVVLYIVIPVAIAQALRRALLVAGGWSLLGSLLFALLFLLGGRLFIELQSDIMEVRNAAYPYLPHLALLPLIAVWSYLLDGLFIGATRAREMRDAMLASVALGLVFGALLQDLGNHGLWLALLCFMLMRGLSLAILGWRLQRQDAWLATSH